MCSDHVFHSFKFPKSQEGTFKTELVKISAKNLTSILWYPSQKLTFFNAKKVGREFKKFEKLVFRGVKLTKCSQ